MICIEMIYIFELAMTDNTMLFWSILNSPEIIMTNKLWGGFCYRKYTARIAQTKGSWMIGAVGMSSETWFLFITDDSKLYGKG